MRKEPRLLTGEQLLVLFIAAALLAVVVKALEWRIAAVQLTPLARPAATSTPVP